MIKKAKNYFSISIFCVFLNSLMIAFVPFVSYGDSTFKNIISYLISAGLWMFFILSWIFLAKTQKERIKAQRKLGYGKIRRSRLKVGMLNFNASFEGLISDVIVILSAIALIITSILWIDNQYVTSINVAILVFSIQMRCILNGRIYIDLKLLESRRLKNE